MQTSNTIMTGAESRLTRKGQVTIPAEMRTRLGLKPKDRVRFHLEHGAVRLERVTTSLRQGYGAVTPRQRPENYRHLRQEFEQGVAARKHGPRRV